jgi:nucleoside-diphosphate-sugar epimerase
VITSGIGLLANGRGLTEDDAPDPSTGTAHRMPAERAALAQASRNVRSSVVRLSPSVHGDGDHAFVPALIAIARAKGVSAYVGEGRNRWPAVHRLDAARLFVLALEKGPAGSTFHGVADEGVPTREIAEIIGRRLQVPVVSKSREEAAAHFGWLAGFIALDAPASSARTQERLGWRPRHPGLIADLEQGRYFEA